MTNTSTPLCVTEARARLMARHVFFATLLYQVGDLIVLPKDKPPMWQGMLVDTACTDGRKIVISEAFFETLALDERVFVLAHEIFHVMARHPTRMSKYAADGSLRGLPWDSSLFNITADAVINHTLIESHVGRMPKNGVLFPDGIKDPKTGVVVHRVSTEDTPEDIYEVMAKHFGGKKQGGQGQGQGDQGQGQGDQGQGQGDQGQGQGQGDQGQGNPAATPRSFGGQGEADDDLKEPAQGEAGAPVSEAEMKAAVQSAANAAKAQGTLPAGLKSFIDNFLDPQVPWADMLRASLTAASHPDSYTWVKPNRRHLVRGLYMPRRISTKFGHVVCSVDSSGSVSDKLLSQFMGEVSSILRDLRPRNLTLIWCDATVERVDELNEPEELLDLVRSEGVVGRGGTSFKPPFRYIENELGGDVDIHIYLTDGYAPFPDESASLCPTIWVISSPEVTAPFGETIHIVEER